MYRKEINFWMFCLSISLFCSCQRTILIKENIDSYVESNNIVTNEIRKVAVEYFSELISSKRNIVLPFILSSSWSIDTVVYVSEDNRRFYSNLLKRQVDWKDAKLESAIEFVGAHIDGKWYYLMEGGAAYYPRDNYKYDANTPLTFEELSYLVNQRRFSKVVSEVDGEYKVSEEFFTKKLGELDSSAPNGDSLFLQAIENLSTKIVPQEKLDRIRQEQLDSKPRELPKRTLWQRWFGKKKLFDSRAWKNSIKDK